MPNAAHARAVVAALPYRKHVKGRVVPNYDSTFTPCGCVTHQCVGVSCTGVERRTRNWARCLACGTSWREAKGLV